MSECGQSMTPITDKLIGAVARYGVDCSETRELAPSTELANSFKAVGQLEASLAETAAALRSILGGPEIVDEKIGWLGQTASTINHYQCEFCRAENLDCTKIEHTSLCPIPPIRALVAKHSG